VLLECFWLVCCGPGLRSCMQTESSLPLCNALWARDTHANDASGEHWSFLGQIVCLLVSYRTLAGLVLETSSGTLAGLRTPAQRREHSKGLLQQRSSRAAASAGQIDRLLAVWHTPAAATQDPKR
jgi:hypothetical protein